MRAAILLERRTRMYPTRKLYTLTKKKKTLPASHVSRSSRIIPFASNHRKNTAMKIKLDEEIDEIARTNERKRKRGKAKKALKVDDEGEGERGDEG